MSQVITYEKTGHFECLTPCPYDIDNGSVYKTMVGSNYCQYTCQYNNHTDGDKKQVTCVYETTKILMPGFTIFSRRKGIADKCEALCKEHSIPPLPFNIVSAALKLGLLKDTDKEF